MKKRYIAIFLSFATVIALFTACVKSDKETEKEEKEEVVLEEVQINEYMQMKDGKIYYRESVNDDYYELVTDKNGVTKVDENGNLLRKVEDDRINPVSYPAFLIEGNKMSCRQFTITCPKGWESSGVANFRMKNEKENRSIEYSFMNETDKNYKNIEENIKYFEDVFKPMVDEGTAVLTRSTTQIAGREAEKLVIEVNNYGEKSYMESYYVQGKDGIMFFSCHCNVEDKGFDFKAILDTIEYRY